MRPEEKAKELYLKFLPYDVELCDSLGDILVGEIERHAKRCALIAVNEIIDALSEYDNRNNTYKLQNMDRDFNYWQKVKEEIEKL